MNNPLDKWVSNYPIIVQFQGTMIGIVLMLVSLIGYTVYTIFWADGTWLWKTFVTVNSLCGVLILWSFYVTTYQQAQAYKEAMELR